MNELDKNNISMLQASSFYLPTSLSNMLSGPLSEKNMASVFDFLRMFRYKAEETRFSRMEATKGNIF